MADESIEQFLAACGGGGPLRLAVEEPGATAAEVLEFPRPFALIGRAAGVDVVLDHPEVGRRHVYLQRIGGRLFCTDLGSRTGVRRENGPGGSGWLGPGEAIRVGPYLVRTSPGGVDVVGADPGASGEAASPLESSKDPAGDLPTVTLEFPRQRSEVVAWRMNRVLALIGRARGCQVRMEGVGVARHHCSLLRTPDGPWAVDLLGQVGILVNGRRVRFARLGDGDEIRIGNHRIRVRVEPRHLLEPRGVPAILGMPGLPMAASRRISHEPAPLDPSRGPELAGLADSLLCHMAGQFGQLQQQMFDQFQQTMSMMAQMFAALHRDQAEAVRTELDRLRQLNQDLTSLQSELTALLAAAAPAPSAPALTCEEQPPGSPAPSGTGLGHGIPLRPPGPPGSPSGDSIHLLLSNRIAEMQAERQGRLRRLVDLMMSRSAGGEVP